MRLYQEAFGCDAQVGGWTATNRNRLAVRSVVGAEYRSGKCTFPRGNYQIEFLEFREKRKTLEGTIRSLQKTGAAIVEFLVAENGYDRSLAALRSNGAEFVVPDGQVTVIQDRKSVILRSPDHLFVEPRSTRR